MASEFQEQLWLYLRELQDLLLRIFHDLASETDLALPQIALLFEICNHPDTTISQLSERISMNKGNCSTMCKRLERQGFLIRERNPRDERVVLLHPTEQGQKACQLVADCLRKQKFALLQSLPPEEIKQIKQSMEQVIAFLHQLLEVKEEEHHGNKR